MNDKRYKYTDNQIIEAVKKSATVVDVIRILGSSATSGGCHKHISYRMKKLGLSKKSFGKPIERFYKRKKPEDVFVLLPEGSPRNGKIPMYMERIGIKKECTICKIREWNGKPLRVEVDHIDGNPLNNKLENLRFLCPNCHSQTETYVFKKRKNLMVR